MVEVTSSRIESPPRRVGDRNCPNNNDDADVVGPRTEGISVNDLEAAGSRVRLELTEVLMHILAIGESALQSESNRFCSHKARSCVDRDFHLRQVLVLARTFWRRTSSNSPRSSSIRRTLAPSVGAGADILAWDFHQLAAFLQHQAHSRSLFRIHDACREFMLQPFGLFGAVDRTYLP